MIPKQFSTKNPGWLLAWIMLITCLGCEQMFKPKDTQPSAPVSGKVLAGNQPVANAKILFLPLNPADGNYRYSYATTNEQGRFTMRFESGIYGAQVGKNLVLISGCQKEETEEADGKVAEKIVHDETISPNFNTDSTLLLDVDLGGNANVVFQVELLENAARLDSAAQPAE